MKDSVVVFKEVHLINTQLLSSYLLDDGLDNFVACALT